MIGVNFDYRYDLVNKSPCVSSLIFTNYTKSAMSGHLANYILFQSNTGDPRTQGIAMTVAPWYSCNILSLT